MITDLASFREIARPLLAARVAPDQALLRDAGDRQESLFSRIEGQHGGGAGEGAAGDRGGGGEVRLPKELFALAENVALHRDEDRWALLYRVAYRLLYEERNLLRIAADPDTARLFAMDGSVKRDVHKMHAFVRFRKIEMESGEEPRYVAFHRPDHRIVRLAAPFFADRFAALRFSILTPDECAHWDGEALWYSPGVTSREAPSRDALEDLWRDYYRATFNPARVRVRAMKAELPVRHWATLPEAEIIGELLREAPSRVSAMMAESEAAVREAGEDAAPARRRRKRYRSQP